MSEAIDPALERTPPSVAAMKRFKNKLLEGHKVTASQFGVDLPKMTVHEDAPYDDAEDEDTLVDVDEEQNEPPARTFIHENADARRDPLHLLASYMEQTPATEDVKVFGEFGKLGFKAINVSITEYGIAFIIRKDVILFEPKLSSELTVNYRGKDYSVIYAGGFFTFPKIPFTFVSFLRVQSE
ncbi:MAG: hypothetical protein ABFD50_21690 [Smithella sp.]